MPREYSTGCSENIASIPSSCLLASFRSSIRAGPAETGLSTKIMPATLSIPNSPTYAATSCTPWDHPTSTTCGTASCSINPCRSFARTSGVFPSVVFVGRMQRKELNHGGPERRPETSSSNADVHLTSIECSAWLKVSFITPIPHIGRGVDAICAVYQWLDRAPKGRNNTGCWWRRYNYGKR